MVKSYLNQTFNMVLNKKILFFNTIRLGYTDLINVAFEILQTIDRMYFKSFSIINYLQLVLQSKFTQGIYFFECV
jgi:hypothetical protein